MLPQAWGRVHSTCSLKVPQLESRETQLSNLVYHGTGEQRRCLGKAPEEEKQSGKTLWQQWALWSSIKACYTGWQPVCERNAACHRKLCAFWRCGFHHRNLMQKYINYDTGMKNLGTPSNPTHWFYSKTPLKTKGTELGLRCYGKKSIRAMLFITQKMCASLPLRSSGQTGGWVTYTDSKSR